MSNNAYYQNQPEGQAQYPPQYNNGPGGAPPIPQDKPGGYYAPQPEGQYQGAPNGQWQGQPQGQWNAQQQYGGPPGQPQYDTNPPAQPAPATMYNNQQYDDRGTGSGGRGAGMAETAACCGLGALLCCCCEAECLECLF